MTTGITKLLQGFSGIRLTLKILIRCVLGDERLHSLCQSKRVSSVHANKDKSEQITGRPLQRRRTHDHSHKALAEFCAKCIVDEIGDKTRVMKADFSPAITDCSVCIRKPVNVVDNERRDSIGHMYAVDMGYDWCAANFDVFLKFYSDLDIIRHLVGSYSILSKDSF